MASEEDFLKAIRAQETGGLADPWIRTSVYDSGSTAYGPYQVTKGLNDTYLRNSRDLFTEEEAAALQQLVERQALAAKVGGSKDRKKAAASGKFSKEQLDAYDYGGSLGIPDKARPHIESAQKKMLLDVYKRNGGDFHAAALEWHGGRNHGNRKPHTNYADQVGKRIQDNRDPRPRKDAASPSSEAYNEALRLFERYKGQ
jgi:hypothetical protein